MMDAHADMYTSLVAACVHTEQLDRAVGVLDGTYAQPANVRWHRNSFAVWNSDEAQTPSGHYSCRRVAHTPLLSSLQSSQASLGSPGLHSLTRVVGACADMYAARLQPARDDVKMYTVLLSALGKQWKQHTALAVFERMRTAGMRPNTITFNAVIGVCGKDGRWEKALELLEQMQEDGLAPDLVTFNSLIAACGVGEQWELAADMVRLTFYITFFFWCECQREPAGSPGPIGITRGTNHLDPWNI